MKRLTVLVLLSAALVLPASTAASGARHETSEGSFVRFNPCTNEDVWITDSHHYLIFRLGDRAHTSDGHGIGLTTGTEYLYVARFVETVHGSYDVVRLIATGPTSDMTLTDYLFDPSIPPTITCS